MSHTQVQVCKKLDNLVGEKNQLISKSLPRTVKNLHNNKTNTDPYGAHLLSYIKKKKKKALKI
jgi:hypothetical protein